MSEGIVIRDMQGGDVERLVEIALAAWEPIFKFFREALGESVYALAFPDWRQLKGDNIRDCCRPGSKQAVFVAEVEGNIAGFVCCHLDKKRPVGEIGNNAVDPAFQGRGIAGLLYERAFQHMREQGMRAAKVVTGADHSHAPARRAYEKAGFNVFLPVNEYYRKL